MDRASRGGKSVRGLSQGEPPGPLLGRDAELAALRDAFDASCRALKPVVVQLEGEGGIGKSALCAAFLSGLRGQQDVLVFAGDAPGDVIEALARHLRKLPARVLATLLPRDTFALRREFPGLSRIPAIAGAPERELSDPLELRARAFGAFGELVGCLGARQTLVVCLDDLPDSDLQALLRGLARPDASRVLVIASFCRPTAPTASALRLDVRAMTLGPLPLTAAHALVESFGGQVPVDWLDQLGGNPRVLSELARLLAETPPSAGRPRRRRPASEPTPVRGGLQDIIVARAGSLRPQERRLLDVIAVAGRAIDVDCALATLTAVGSEAAAQSLLEALRASRLVRIAAGDATVECLHEIVRSALLEVLSADVKREHHASLARALAARSDVDREQVAQHLVAAGQTQSAAVQFALAADAAFRIAANDRASRLYARALQHGSFEPIETQRLQIAHADALADAGRGARAARAYLAVAHSVDREQAHALEQRAAEQYLLSGRLHEGRQLLAAALLRDGLLLPPGGLGSEAWFQLERARLSLRGLEMRPPSPTVTSLAPGRFRSLDARSLLRTLRMPVQRLDQLNDSALALSQLDPWTSAALGVRQLRLALNDANRAQAALGLAAEIRHASYGVADSLQVPELSTRLEALCASLVSRAAPFELHAVRGYYRLYGPRPDPASALSELDRCLELSEQGRIRFAPYRRSMLQRQRLVALVMLGRFAEVARELPQLLDAAWERGDFAVLPLLADGHASLALIATGALDEAQRELERAVSAWSPHRDIYTFQDLALIQGTVQLALARGRVEQAWQSASAELGRRSALRAPPLIAQALHAIAARAALAQAQQASRLQRARLLRVVRRRLLPALAPDVRSEVAIALASLEGRHEAALRLARYSLGTTTDVERQPLREQLKRRTLGVLRADAKGRDLSSEADAFLRQGGAVEPSRIFAVLAPGFRAHP